MLYLSSCPKCKKGTIEFTQDKQGKYIHCLMCGFNKNSDSKDKLFLRLHNPGKKPPGVNGVYMVDIS